MKEKLLNIWLGLRSQFIFMFNINVYDIPNLVTKHEILFIPGIDLVSTYFQDRAEYGRYTDDIKPKQWYDPLSVQLGRKGLELHVSERSIITDKGVTIDRGVGFLWSKFETSYGLYSWLVKLPEGNNLHPALWLTHVDTWPPEIDILEGYTDDKGRYQSRLESAVHVGVMPNKTSKTIKHGWFIKKDKFLQVSCLWLKDSISIYYNNVLVRKITDPSILGYYNINPKMRVVMNNAVRHESDGQTKAPFIIDSFIYQSLL